jgi:hypothetical protein
LRRLFGLPLDSDRREIRSAMRHASGPAEP